MTTESREEAANYIGKREKDSWGITLTAEQTTLDVRLEGGYIIGFKVGGEDILYCGNARQVKTSATHAMAPVGQTDDDTQHGVSRWRNFDIVSASSDSLTLRMYDHQRELEFERRFLLSDGSVVIETSVTNRGKEPWLGSVGEHTYLAIDEDQIPNVKYLGPNKLTFVDKEGNPYQDYSDIIEGVLAKEAFIARGFHGEQNIQLTENKVITIKATASLDGKELPPPDEVLVWHRPGTDSFCPAETITGLGESMEVLSGSTLTLRTEIIVNPQTESNNDI